MKWACAKAYVYANQGTDYSFFKAYFKEHGLDCDMLTWTQCMSATSPVREQAIKKLQDGYYLIALMKKGNWTSGGHYVVVWWSDGKVRINDPASTRDDRLNGDHTAFWSTAKYFWWVDARKYNNPKEDDDMDVKRFKELWIEMRKELQDNDASQYSEEARAWAKKNGIVSGGSENDFNGMWEDVLTREQMVTMLYRFAKLLGRV